MTQDVLIKGVRMTLHVVLCCILLILSCVSGEHQRIRNKILGVSARGNSRKGWYRAE